MWELLFKYPADMFARGTIALSVSGWVYVAIVIGSAIAIPTLLLYRRATSALAPADRIVLSLIRTAVVAVLVLALFQPTLTVTNTVSQRNVVAFLLDDSISMNVADQDGATRAAFMAKAFHPDRGEVTKAIARRFEPKFFAFAGEAVALDAQGEMSFAGAHTHLDRALSDVRGTIDPRTLAALVIVSDGAVTRAAALDAELSAYRAADVPISTVAVGQARFERDLEVSTVSMPRSHPHPGSRVR